MATEIQLETAINTANSAKSLRELSKSLRELVALQGQIGEGGADFKKLQKAINDTEGRVGDLNDSFGTLRGSGIERVNASLSLFREGLANADTSKLELGLRGIGAAMKAIPIFLLIEGLKYVYENFDKVKDILSRIIPSWKEQRDLIQENIDRVNGLSRGIENLRKLNTKFYAEVDAETQKEIERLKRLGKTTKEINEFIISQNELKLGQLKDDYESAVDEEVAYTKYGEAAKEKLKIDSSDEQAKAQVEYYEKLKQATQDALNEVNTFERNASVQREQLTTANLEFEKEAIAKADEAREAAWYAELERINTLRKRREELAKRQIDEDTQTYAELEAMKKKSQEKEAEGEDIAFITSLKKGEKQFEIEQEERQKHLDGRLDALESAKNKELVQVTEGSEAAYLIEKKYAELAFQEKAKQYSKYLDYAKQGAQLANDINKILVANENYNLQQMQYQKDADLENSKNRTQEQIDLETKKTNELIANENLSAAEIERIKFNSETNINKLQSDAANNELEIKQELDKQSLDIRKKQFEREKKIQLVTAGINTAAAVVSALGTVQPFPVALAAAALAATTGAIQIAAISKSKFDDGGASARQGIAPIKSIDTRSAPSSNTWANNSVGSSNPNGQLLGSGLTTNSNAIKVVVLEKDIREVANKVDVLEARSTFGV